MSKLPIAAFYPTGSTPANLFEAHTRNSTRRQGGGPIAHNSINRTAPIITLADSNNTSSPVVLCVDGVLLWLLIAWITAGTAAIITLIVKSCRNRYLNFPTSSELHVKPNDFLDGNTANQKSLIGAHWNDHNRLEASRLDQRVARRFRQCEMLFQQPNHLFHRHRGSLIALRHATPVGFK